MTVNETTHLTPPPRTDNPRACLTQARKLGVPKDYGQTRQLRRIQEPTRLVFIGHDTQQRPQWLAPRAASAWVRMREAALSDGVELQIVSAYRSIEYQLGILKRKREQGQDIHDILKVSAAPGYSEHHSGRALDITTPGCAPLQEEFERSCAFTWLKAHAKTYSFFLSFPRANAHGIAFEPWHWCWQRKKSGG
jgi:D-alanyl-D-alanine carboxypeptidase